MTSPKPTDSKQVKEWAKSIGLFRHKETDDYYEYWSNKEIYRIDYEQLAFFYQAMVERDRQRLSAWTTERATYRRTWIPKADVLSAALEAAIDAFKNSTYQNVDNDAKYWSADGDYNAQAMNKFFPQNWFDEKFLPALTAALDPDNSKIEE